MGGRAWAGYEAGRTALESMGCPLVLLDCFLPNETQHSWSLSNHASGKEEKTWGKGKGKRRQQGFPLVANAQRSQLCQQTNLAHTGLLPALSLSSLLALRLLGWFVIAKSIEQVGGCAIAVVWRAINALQAKGKHCYLACQPCFVALRCTAFLLWWWP